MITELGGTSPKTVHVSGLPMVAETGKALETPAILSLPLSDREGWLRFAKSLRGQFAIVVSEPDFAVVVTDLTGSYPVFRLAKPNGEPWKLATSLVELEKDSTRSVRRSALCQYVAFGAMDMDGETIFADIDRIPGGAVAFYSRDERGTVKGEAVGYAAWYFMAGAEENDADAAEQRLTAIIRTYTEANMALPKSDGRLGMLLSGGTDSTLLTAVLREQLGDRLACFTQHFKFRRYSEFSQAQANAHALGVTTEPVMLGRSEHLAAILALNSAQQDQPCVTMQAFNLWSLVRSVSANPVSSRCNTFMAGEHADSLFLGFGHFFHGLPSETQAYMAATSALSSEEKLRWVLPRIAVDDNDSDLLAVLGVPKQEYLDWLRNFSDAKRARLAPFTDGHLTTLQQLNGQVDGGLSWQRIILPVTRSLKGLQVLTPFFDPAMIALALSLPPSFKYRDGKTKFFLRALLHKYIGRELPKQPAAASPVAIWRILPSVRERAGISPSLRPYYDKVATRNVTSLGRMVNHYIKVAALGLWMGARKL